MKIKDRLMAVETMIAENPSQLAITLPVHSVRALLDHCRDRDEIQQKYLRARERAQYYEDAYNSAKAEIKRRSV